MAGRTYKTAQGVIVDIDQMRLLNERTVAVGNMGVNSRGDLVNSDGSIKESRNEIMKKTYRTNAVVGGKGGDIPPRTDVVRTKPAPAGVVPDQNINAKGQIDTQPTTPPTPTAPLRGSLAQAISDVVPETKEAASDLLSTSTNTRTIKRI